MRDILKILQNRLEVLKEILHVSGCSSVSGSFSSYASFSILFRSFQRRLFSRESFRPLHRQPAVHPAHALSYPFRIIFLATPAVRPTRQGAARGNMENPLLRRGWERCNERAFLPYKWQFSIFTFHPIYCKEQAPNFRSSDFASLSWRYFQTRITN